MKKFEYKKFWCDSVYHGDLMSLLGKEGKNGWEPVYIDNTMNADVTVVCRFVIMKREIGS